MTSQRYFPGLDFVRIFAALSVVFYHFGYFTWLVVGPGGPNGPSGPDVLPLVRDVAKNAWVGVNIFFVLSGVVIAQSSTDKSYSDFAIGRALRLMPAAWICATITLIFLIADYNAAYLTRVYLGALLFYPFPPWIDGAYWTLGIEVNFYLLALLMIAIRQQERLVVILSIGGIVSSAICGMAYFGIAGFDTWLGVRWSQLLLLQHCHYFAMGVLLWRVREAGITWPAFALLGVYFAGSCAEILWLVKAGNINAFYIFCFGILGIAASIGLPSLSGEEMKVISPLRILALATYPLYLVHNVVGRKIIRFLVPLNVPDWAAIFGTVLLLIFISVAVVYAERYFKSRVWIIS